jgi:mRNA interferase RelE/StbE
VIAANTVSDIVNIKKLSGFKYHYRIRIGNYRVGIVIKNNEVIFERFLHRKDIYKYYP